MNRMNVPCDPLGHSPARHLIRCPATRHRYKFNGRALRKVRRRLGTGRISHVPYSHPHLGTGRISRIPYSHRHLGIKSIGQVSNDHRHLGTNSISQLPYRQPHHRCSATRLRHKFPQRHLRSAWRGLEMISSQHPFSHHSHQRRRYRNRRPHSGIWVSGTTRWLRT